MARKKSYNLILYELQQQAIEEEKRTGHKVTSNMALEKQAHEEYIAPIKNVNPANSAVKIVHKDQKELKNADKNTFKKTWLSKGAFDDGYQIGDVTKTILGTTADIGVGAVKGLGRLGEGLLDVGSYGVAGISEAFGNDDFANKVKRKAKKNTTDDLFSPLENLIDPYSVIGEKGDSVSEGLGYVAGMMATGGLAGAAGLGTAGATVLTTGITGLSSMGSGMSEAYQGGATDEEAVKYGIIAGVAEAGSELIFGGLGKAVNALGFSKGLSSLDDALAKKISSKLTSTLSKNLAEYTVKAGAEGVEEVISGIAQGIGKKVTYMSDEELVEILKDENLLEQFIVGTVTSSIAQAPGLVKTTSQGRDFISNYTQNEQKVVDAEVESRVNEQQKAGKELTNKEISNIREQVEQDFEKGYVSTDTIENTLGKKLTAEQEADIEAQLNTLLQQSKTATDPKQTEQIQQQMDMLEEQLSTSRNIDYSNDAFIQKSYQEKALRGQNYKADITKYDAKQQKIIQKAIDSGILNDTHKTHEFVDMIAKIAADKDISFDFSNNEKLKASGFAVEGKTIDGFVSKDGITLNIDSNKALNKVVGHEITHILEGTELYTELQKAVKEYATTKGIWDSRLAEITDRYKSVEGANVENELTSDLVGEYLFTDADFVYNLSITKPNVFKKIYNEIKYLLKVATAGSTEARQLEKVKKTFEKAYQAQGTQTTDTKYSVSDNQGRTLSKEQQEYFKDSKVRDDNGNLEVVYHMTNSHFNIIDFKKNAQGLFWFASSKEDLQNGSVSANGTRDKANSNIKELYANIKNPASWEEYDKYTIEQLKEKGYDGAILKEDDGSFVGFVFNNSNQIKNVDNTNPTSNPDTRYSLSEDNQGNELKPSVQKWAENSKARDENGNLKVLYHGTATGEFTVFDKSRASAEADWGKGFYLTDNENDVESNYEDGGPDFENKISHLAERIQDEQDISYDEAEKIAEEQLYKGSYKITAYANMENPAIVGETYLFNYKDYADDINADLEAEAENYVDEIEERARDNYGLDESEVIEDHMLEEARNEILDEYGIKQEIEEKYIVDEIDSAIWAIEREYDFYNGTDEIRNLLYEAFYDGGIEIQELNNKLGELYLETDDGIVGGDVARIIIESLGYDGIIDPTVSRKFPGMYLDEGTTHYIAFKENQIKSITNENPTTHNDINMSLSAKDEEIAPTGQWNVRGEDIKLQLEEAIAPLQETISNLTEQVQTLQDNIIPTAEQYKEVQPTQPTLEEVQNLIDIRDNKSGSEYARAFYALRDKYGQVELYKSLNEYYSTGTVTQPSNVGNIDTAPVSQEVVEKQGQEAFNTITDKDAPSFEDVVDEAIWDIPFESDNSTEVEVKSPLEERDIDEVGNRSVKAYQYENPEVKPYFQEEAQNMLYDLDNTIKGERGAAIDELGNMEYYGITRQTTEAIAYLKDNYGYSYDQIRQGLNKIIEDDGKENNAVSKRIEFMLDERLREGYTTSDGIPIPANQDYVNFLSQKQITEYNKEAFNAISDEDIPLYEKIEPQKQVVTGESTQVKQTTPMKLKTAQNGNTDVTEGKQRKWVETSTESEVVNREILPDDLDQEKIYYQPITNKATLSTANAKLSSLGYEKSVEYFNNQILNKTVRVEDIALGERLIQEAIKNKDTKTAGELIQNVAILGTELGQKVQALSIIQRMTPEGQLKMLEKTINRGKAKGDKAFTDVNLTDDMRKKILDTYNKDGSYNKEALDKAVEDVKQEIADQMPATMMDKVNAWRYLSMLGNPKTHIRNLVSNVAMKGTVAVKNALARTIETIAPIKNRTRTWKTASDDVITFAQKTALEMKDVISGDNKYSETADIKAKRDAFKNKILNKIANLNSDLLEKEDWWFSKGAFENSFREFLTANGIKTQEDIKNKPELIEKGKNYAVEQAQIATFRQYSWLANKIRDIENKNAATQIAVGAVLPFKKTPINIAKTGLSYSPIGALKSLTYDLYQVGQGKMEASQAIDNIAQGATGTALTLIGYMLAQAGLVNGAGDDDKESKYDYQLGKQAYSLNIGGKTYSISWLSPVAMPLLVGANFYEQLVEKEEWNADVVMETLGQTLDPLSEMSFLSSFTDVLSSYEQGDMRKLFSMFEAMGQNYATQFIPTASSQLAATLDDTKRTTKVSGDSTFKQGEELYNKLIYKIPGLRETLEPTTDIWGNEVKQSENLFTRAFENFIAPYSRKDSIATEIDEELKDLYSQTGDTGILPSIPYNYVNYDGEKYKMSAEEYTDYKKMYGQTANDLLEDLFRTTTYKNATSEERADMVNDVYDYARDEAKLDYLAKEGVDYTNATEDKVEVYKENLIKGAIENDMTTKEYGLYVEDPKEYKFLMEKDYEYRRKYFDTYDSLKDIDEAFEKQKEGINDDDELDVLYSDKKAGIVDKIINSGLDDTEKASLYKRYYSSDTVDTIVKSAISIDDYLVYETKEFKADKNAKGNSIPGSRKDKVIDYVNTLDMSIGQKAILIKSTNTFKFNDYNEQIVRYVDGLGLSFEEVKSILEDLDMTVDDKGNVFWD